MKKYDTLTCGIFYCRESAEINGCGSLQTSSRVDSDVLRNRQQKHTAKTLSAIRNKVVQKKYYICNINKK
jgi:hypothetical protein